MADRIVKIIKPWDTDNLMNEFDNHQRFIWELERLRDTYTSWPEKELLENFDIPMVSKVWSRDWIYEMDWIEGRGLQLQPLWRTEMDDYRR
jgi:hypothetical protein